MDNYSNIINIIQCLENIEDYVIIKKANYFPKYYDFDDIDIFCQSREPFIKKLQFNLFKQVGDQFGVTVTTKTYNTHVDIFPPNTHRLNLRFDVYDSFPYQEFFVNPSYFLYILHNKKTVEYDKIKIMIPDELDDIILRFFEWIEKPKKTKHLLYTKKNLKDCSSFIKTIRRYTNIPSRFVERAGCF